MTLLSGHLVNYEIMKKANRTLGFVKRNIKTKNQSVKELAYKTIVRPQVEYASTVWSLFTKQNIQKVETVQRRASRWVTSRYSSYDSVTEMLTDLGWRSLENRRINARLAMFYKIMVLLPCQCLHILSVPSDYLVTCILLVSARYMQLQIIIGTRFFQ